MITCAGSETVLLDGATDGIALTIDVSSTVIRQAVAPCEFYQSSLLPTPTLVSDTCSPFLSKRTYIQEWGMYADQLPKCQPGLSLLIVQGSNGCYVILQEPKRR